MIEFSQLIIRHCNTMRIWCSLRKGGRLLMSTWTSMRQPFTFTTLLSVFFASSLFIIEEEEASCLVGVDEVDVQNHDGEVGEAWGHVLLGEMRTQASPLWISAWGWIESLWESNVDHVPELGVMGVHTVHEQVQPLEEEFRIRTHVDKVCSLWPLNLDWDVQIFLHFRFAVFLKIRFVFLSNQHFLISIRPLELVANLATRWRHLPFASRKFGHHMIHCLHILEPLALIANLATRRRLLPRHHLHQLQISSPSGTTCIGSKFGHQLAPLALLPKLATRLCYLYCYIALDCPIDIIS